VAVGALRRLWSPKWRWLTITVLWAGVVALAMWGMTVGNPRNSTWNRLYAVPDFFGMTISDETAALDWRIQAARFLAPAIFASTFYAATAAIFRDQIGRFRLRFANGHVIVVGLGDKGSRLAMSFAAAGRRVAAIEEDPNHPNRATVQRHGVTVLTGDGSDAGLLEEAGVKKAADLVVVCDDATNAEVVAVARRVERDPTRASVRATVHLVDPQMSRLLRTRELAAGTATMRFDFFNIFQRGARLWLADVDPFEPRPDGRPPHLVVLGVGVLGESLAVAAAQRWAERRTDGDGPLRITLVDPDATARFRSLRLRHPALLVHTAAEAIDLDPDRPVPDAAEAFESLLAEGSVTAAFVCHEDDTAALSTALFVRHALGTSRATVAVRTRSADGLALLVDDDRVEGEAAGISGFPLFDRTCTADAIDGGTNETIARALHDDYLARARADDREGPTIVPWDELDEDTRESNRRAADGLVGALSKAGCLLAPLYGWDDRDFTFTDGEVDLLARNEHDRWSEDRKRLGWSFGERDNARKLHPLLVPWKELAEPDRDQNRGTVRDYPAMLARAGFELVRTTSR
jgi:voltage-gated potassium channel Kch